MGALLPAKELGQCNNQVVRLKILKNTTLYSTNLVIPTAHAYVRIRTHPSLVDKPVQSTALFKLKDWVDQVVI